MFESAKSTSAKKESLDDKKIVIVLDSLNLGGAERQALLLARYLKKVYGAYVEVWGFGNPGRVSELCQDAGLLCDAVPWPWDVRRTQRLRRLVSFASLIRRKGFHIILPYTHVPNIICGLTWRWSGARLCVWNQRDEGRDYFKPRIEPWAVRQTPWFVSNSEVGIDYIVRNLGVSPQRVRFIRNGIEMGLPVDDRRAWRHRLGVSEKSIVACMVANIHTYKDHATLLKAWRKVLDSLPPADEAILALAGRLDNAADNMQSLAVELKLDKSVRFLGPVKDIGGLLSAADFGVFSSKLEGCPNGVLECLAAGLPVAGTDIAGIRDAVGPEGSFLLAQPGNVDELADRILHLITDQNLRRRMGQLGRRRIRTHFTPERMCEETVRFLSERV